MSPEAEQRPASAPPPPQPSKLARSWKGLGVLDLIVMLGSILIMFIFVVLPLVALMYGALQDRSPTRGATNWSLRAVERVYTTAEFLPEIINTFEISIWVTLVAVLIGTILAWTVARTDTPGRGFIEIMAMMPLLLSPFVGATAWMALAAPQSGFINGLLWGIMDGPIFNIFSKGGVIFTMTLYFVPYAYLFSIASFKSMDPSLEEAARMVGANNLRTMRSITFPLMLPAIAAGTMLIFVMASEMFSIPGILGRPAGYINLPYLIYRAIRTSPPDWPLAATLGTVLIWVAIVGMYFYRRLTKASQRFVTISGKGYRPAIVKIGKLKYFTLGIGILYGFLANALPYGALVLGSFLTYLPGRDLNLSHFTLKNYDILTQDLFLLALRNSIVISSLTPTVIVVLAVILSFVILRTRIPGRGLIDTVATFPIAVPGMVFGIGVLWAYFMNPLPIYGTILMLAFAYIGRYLPQGLRIASSTLLQIHRDLEESARVHGATGLQTLARITFPLLRPPMVYAWIMVFMLVVREVGAAVVVYGPGSIVLPVLIWDILEGGNLPAAYAMGVVQTILVLAVVMIARVAFGLDMAKQQPPGSNN